MSDTDFDTLFDDKARAAHAAGPVGYDEEGVRQAVRLFWSITTLTAVAAQFSANS